MTAPPRSEAAAARRVHWALVASVAVWLLVFLVLRTVVRPLPLPAGPRAWVKPVFLAVMAIMTFLNVHARRRMQDEERKEADDDTWWRRNRPAVYGAWASAEVAVIASLVLWYLHGFGGMPLMAGGWALFLLVAISRPGPPSSR